jgi:hypothetical protein
MKALKVFRFTSSTKPDKGSLNNQMLPNINRSHEAKQINEVVVDKKKSKVFPKTRYATAKQGV